MGNTPSAHILKAREEEREQRRNPKSHLPAHLTPRAAVIGAGLAGLHVAKELGGLGFDVTVFDTADGPGAVAAQHSSGVFGAGVAWTPSMWVLNVRRELFWGLFPLSARTLMGGETPPLAVFHSPHYRWAYNRFYRSTDAASLAKAATYLAAETEVAMLRSAAGDKALASAVIQAPVAQPTEPVAGRHIAELGGLGGVVDVPRWVRALEKHCADEYGVDFVYGTAVTKFNYELVDSVERMDSLVLTDVRTQTASIKAFDLAVMCCGSSVVDMTWTTYPVPLVSLAGYGVNFPVGHSAFEQLARARAGVLTAFGEDGVLRLSPTTPAADGQERLQLGGLLSLDARPSAASPSYVLRSLAARLRLQAGIDIGTVQPEDTSVETFRWVRHFTPDGLPIISRLGNAQNVFVCSGFGDDATLFAAGAARVLGRIVTGRVDDGRLNPFSLARFPTFKLVIPDHRESIAFKMYRNDASFALWSDEVFIRPLRAAFRENPLVEYLGLLNKPDV